MGENMRTRADGVANPSAVMMMANKESKSDMNGVDEKIRGKGISESKMTESEMPESKIPESKIPESKIPEESESEMPDKTTPQAISQAISQATPQTIPQSAFSQPHFNNEWGVRKTPMGTSENPMEAVVEVLMERCPWTEAFETEDMLAYLLEEVGEVREEMRMLKGDSSRKNSGGNSGGNSGSNSGSNSTARGHGERNNGRSNSAGDSTADSISAVNSTIDTEAGAGDANRESGDGKLRFPDKQLYGQTLTGETVAAGSAANKAAEHENSGLGGKSRDEVVRRRIIWMSIIIVDTQNSIAD
jgi:hypothetical protein